MNRWFWAWLVAVSSLVAGLLIVIVPSAQATVTGTLSGTISDSTNHGVKGVVAELISTKDDSVVATAVSATNGTYQISAGAGTYTLCFDGRGGARGTSVGGFVSACYGTGTWDLDLGQAFSNPAVVVGATNSPNYNIALTPAAGVTGTVTAAVGGAPLGGVSVGIYANPNEPHDVTATATSAADGTYSINGLDPSLGTFEVCFSPGAATGGTSTTGYEGQCYSNQPWNNGDELPAGTTVINALGGHVTSGVDAALVAGSSISGRLTDGAAGGVGGVSVLVYTLANGQLATGLGAAVTDSSGNYTVSGLQPSTAGYDLCFDARQASGGASTTGYLGECYANIGWDDSNTSSDLPAATAVPLTAGATVTGINQGLTAAGAIAGKVTAGGAALASVHVTVVGGTSGAITVNTAADGTYRVTGLYPGDNQYWVCFDPSQATGGGSPSGYLGQCYSGKYWDTSLGDIPSTATRVSVSAGATTGAVNAALTRAGGISGTVTAGGQPVSDVTVLVYSVATGFLATGYSTVTTATDGTYTVKGLKPGSSAYRVCFDTTIASGGPSTTGYTDQCYNNSPWDGFTTPTSTKVSVTANALTPAINASLGTAGAISGHVTSVAGGTGVASVNVYVVPIADLALSTGYTSAVTAADGSYTVKRLPPSTSGYAVCFDASAAGGGGSTTGYLDQCANNQSWDGQLGDFPPGLTAIPVSAGATSTVDAQLPSAGAIAGKVTEAGTGVPLANVTVALFDSGNELPASAETAPDGTYRLNALPADSGYVVCFDPSRAIGGGTTGHVSQCYKNQAWDGYDQPPGATAVNVVDGATTGSINAAIKQAGAITGSVTATAGGAPVPSADVTIFDSSKNYVTDVETDNAGTFSAINLPPSTRGYYACVNASYVVTPTAPTGFSNQCYNGVAWNGEAIPSSATRIALAAAQSATANFSLANAGGISGTVTSGGTPLSGVGVYVYDTHGNQITSISSADDGTYLLPGLSPGNYEVCFDGTYATGTGAPAGYSAACWKNKPWTPNSTPAGTKIVVAAGAQVSGINASLTAAAGISGTLSDVHGPVQYANVDVFDQTGLLLGRGFADQNGMYQVNGLSPTTSGDIVCFDVSGATDGTPATLVDQCYQNVTWDGSDLPAGAQPVPLMAGTVQTGIDATIATDGSIAGNVTAQATGTPITKATVYLIDALGNATQVNVNASGAYTFSNVVPATYQVCVQAKSTQTGGPFGLECYNQVAWDGSLPAPGATPVQVNSGQKVTGINIALPPAG